MAAVLLGAGASVHADLPATVAMLDTLLTGFQEQGGNPYGRSEANLLEFVVRSLQQQSAGRGDHAPVDVETMFETIEMLAARSQLPVAPFVSMWDPLVAEAERTA